MASPVDTADPPAVTAAEAVVSLPATETEPVATTETVPQEAPAPEPQAVATPSEPAEAEAEAEPEGPSVGDLDELLGKLSEDERRNLKSVRWLIDRESESVRQKAAHEANLQLADSRQQWVLSGKAEEEMVALGVEAAANLDERGQPQFNKEKFAGLLGRTADAVMMAQTYRLGRVLVENLNDLTLTPEQSRELDQLKSAMQANPVEHGAALVRRWRDLAVEAAIKKEGARLERETEAKVKKDYAARAAIAAAKATAAKRNEQPQPSRAGTGPASNTFSTKAEAHAAHADGRLSTAAFRDIRYGPQWAGLPEF